MHIYTRKGDRGQTRLADSTELGKNEDIFEVIGTIDELNSWVGFVLSVGAGLRPAPWGDPLSGSPLQKIQNDLFTINAILAKSKNITFDVAQETKFLEQEIDKMEMELPPLKNFILPGGSEAAAMLQITRAITRHTERSMTRCSRLDSARQVETSSHKTILQFLPYFNRLSDYFFTLARWGNWKNKVEEKVWKPQESMTNY
jgi:cob(I)alamin adenosyltransferase